MATDLETIYENMLMPDVSTPHVVMQIAKPSFTDSEEEDEDSEEDEDVIEIIKNILKQTSTLDNVALEDVNKDCRSKITRCTNSIRISITELIEKIRCSV